jgi:hypothetical protein
MGRMTRKKAAEVAEQLHIDEDQLLELPSDDAVILKTSSDGPGGRARSPLGEIALNSTDNTSDDSTDLRKSTRSRTGGRKGGKGKKNNFATSTTSKPYEFDYNATDNIEPDENDSAPSPASEKAAEDLLKDIPKCKTFRFIYCNIAILPPL